MAGRMVHITQAPHMPMGDAYFLMGNFGYRKDDPEASFMRVRENDPAYEQFFKKHYDPKTRVIETPLQAVVKLAINERWRQQTLCEFGENADRMIQKVAENGFIVDNDQASLFKGDIKNGYTYEFCVREGKYIESVIVQNILDISREKVTGRKYPGLIRDAADALMFVYNGLSGTRQEEYRI